MEEVKEKLKELSKCIEDCKISGYCEEMKCPLYEIYVINSYEERIDLCDLLCEFSNKIEKY